VIFGHLGVAGMVRATQRDPHGSRAFVLLCIVAVLPDVLDVAFAMSGICSPFGLYTHTLPAIALETAVVGGIAWFATRSARVCVAFAAMVPLHLAADFPTMNKLLMPGGELHGLDLYRRPILDFVLEAMVFTLGWRMLRQSARGPHWSVTGATLVAVLILQGAFDSYQLVTNAPIKPNACYRAPIA
jgi:hypothetical protein